MKTGSSDKSVRLFKYITEEEKIIKINRFREKTAENFNSATHFLLKFQVLEKLEKELSICKKIKRRRIKRGKVVTNRWFKFRPIARFLVKRRRINQKRGAIELSCIQSMLDLINRKMLVVIQLLISDMPPAIQIKSEYGFSAFVKMRSHGYHGKLIFLIGIGEDAVGKLVKEAEHKGIVYELPTTLGYFDGHNFTKRSDIVNAQRADERARERAREDERARERAREAHYSLDSVVDSSSYSSSYSFRDHWRYHDH